MKHLLFLHGALGAQSQFKALKEKFEQDYTCHSLDFFGHGECAFGNRFGIEIFAKQVLEYIEQNEIESCDVFGYSMGGYVALFLEHSHPGTFKKIMTLGTKFDWTPEWSEKEAEFLKADILLKKAPEYAASLEKLHGDKWPQLCEKTAQMMRYLGTLPLVTDLTLTRINIPVRLAIGDTDNMVKIDETVKAFRNLSKGSFLVMPTTPHPIDQVNIDRLSYKIEKFMTS